MNDDKDMTMTALMRALKTASTAKPSTLQAPHEHPRVIEHRRLRADLVSQREAAQSGIAKSVADRDRLLAEDREADVQALLGEPVAIGDRAGLKASLAAINASIALAGDRVASLDIAIGRLDAREPDLILEVKDNIRQAVAERSAAIVATMAEKLVAVAALNAELRRLELLEVGGVVAPSWPELTPGDFRNRLDNWLSMARAAGVKV